MPERREKKNIFYTIEIINDTIDNRNCNIFILPEEMSNPMHFLPFHYMHCNSGNAQAFC